MAGSHTGKNARATTLRLEEQSYLQRATPYGQGSINVAARSPIVIAGGSGFLGQCLTRRLVDQDERVVVLSRQRAVHSDLATYVHWDARTPGDWVQHLDGASALVNLVGRSVDCRKTPDHCDEILRSRVDATRVLGEAIRAVDRPPPVWVQMSTAHIYGDPPDTVCDEASPCGWGLAPHVGCAWEQAAAEAVLPQMRSVVLRTSFVLGRDGGALPRLMSLARWGLGGKVGHGRQGISWIHEADLTRLLERAIRNDSMQGVYVVTSPHPVSNTEFMRELRNALRIPFGLPAPAWMVRIGASWLLDTDPELALYGRYCVPRRLEREGFQFQFGSLQAALEDLCRGTAVAPSLRDRQCTVRA